MSIAQHVRRTRTELEHLRLCVGSGILGIMPPQTLLRGGRAVRDYGSMAGLLGMSAARYPERTAIIDERGSLTFEELNLRSHSLANAWRERGLAPGEGVAILARNHRGLLEATFAAAKCGARIVLLNTDFAGPQIRDVATREGTDLLVYDEEYASMLAGVVPPRGAYRAWTETAAADSLEALIASGSREAPPAPGVAPKIILLTSGTTGTPKGAPRPEPRSLAPFGALLSKVPFRSREVTEICAPMFHTLGFAHAMAAIAFGSTIVVRLLLRSAGRIRQSRPAPRHRHGGGAGHAATPTRLGCRCPYRPRFIQSAHRFRCRITARRGPRHPCPGCPRPGHLQHVRLHRGRVRHHRDSE